MVEGVGDSMIQFNVNGLERSFHGAPEMPVLWYPRDVLGLMGNKVRLQSGALRSLYRA